MVLLFLGYALGLWAVWAEQNMHRLDFCLDQPGRNQIYKKE